MDLEEIKEIIHKEGGKIVIVEQGRPQVIIMAFEEWKKGGRTEGREQARPAAQPEAAPSPSESERRPPAPSSAAREEEEGLTIDDLPL